MKRFLMLAACAAAACGGGGGEAARWRSAGKVYAAMDVAAFYANMQKALVTQGYGEVTINNSPPVYLLREGGVMVYLSESAVPASSSYVPLTPHQAAEAALKQPGATGLCVEPDGAGGCARKLDRAQTEALEAELKKDCFPPLPFEKMARR